MYLEFFYISQEIGAFTTLYTGSQELKDTLEPPTIKSLICMSVSKNDITLPYYVSCPLLLIPTSDITNVQVTPIEF